MSNRLILCMVTSVLMVLVASLPTYAGKGGSQGNVAKPQKEMMKEKHQYKNQKQYEYEEEYKQYGDY